MELGSTSKEYLPSRSVIVPFVVPFTTTFTPKRGSPFASVTVPVTFLACWEMDTFALDAWIGGVTPAPTIRKQSAKPSPLSTKANCLFIITQK